MTMGQIIKQLRQTRGLTQEEVGNVIGVTKGTILKYEKGETQNMKRSNIKLLADFFGVSPSYLMGMTDEGHQQPPDGFAPLPATVKRPRLGVISCGEPIDSPENFDGYDDVPANIHCDFTLVADGDSMINARIQSGDIVYIRQQPTVENGQIAAVLIDGAEKLLKRVYLSADSIVLQAENPAYPPIVFAGEDMNRVSIIGRAVGFTSVIR